MNLTLWIIQALLAAHTALGAVWKFSQSAEQTMPSLKALSGAPWRGLSVVELACAVALVLPALVDGLGVAVPIGAAVVTAEMLLFVALHRASGATGHGPLTYWLVVAAVSGGLAWARWRLAPL